VAVRKQQLPKNGTNGTELVGWEEKKNTKQKKKCKTEKRGGVGWQMHTSTIKKKTNENDAMEVFAAWMARFDACKLNN